MPQYDIGIIGGGIIGCCIARELSRYAVSCVVIEAMEDVGAGTTKANGGLIHSGYDPTPGTMKSRVNARGNQLYTRWSQELGFTLTRKGSMVLGFSESDRAHLKKLLANGRANGVDGLQIIDTEEILKHEPQASPEAICALWCPHTGEVDPFEVAVAAAENAAANGTEFMLEAPVEAISHTGGRFELSTARASVSVRLLINAAGCNADRISLMAGGEDFSIAWRQGCLLILDKDCGVHDIMPLYPVPTPTTKGVVVIGTVHGNVLIGSTAVMRKKGDLDCYKSDISELLNGARKLAPTLNLGKVIREFAGGRAVIESTNDFLIEASKKVPGLFNVAGIQSPGVASAPAIAEYVVQLIREFGEELPPRPDFNPIRIPPVDFDTQGYERQCELVRENPAYGRIVCRCETVPEAEIVEAIHRVPGARSVDAVKRRCRAGMGRCQSGFCQSRVVDILARELGIPKEKVRLESCNSPIVFGSVKEGATCNE